MVAAFGRGQAAGLVGQSQGCKDRDGRRHVGPKRPESGIFGHRTVACSLAVYHFHHLEHGRKRANPAVGHDAGGGDDPRSSGRSDNRRKPGPGADWMGRRFGGRLGIAQDHDAYKARVIHQRGIFGFLVRGSFRDMRTGRGIGGVGFARMAGDARLPPGRHGAALVRPHDALARNDRRLWACC